MTLTKRALTKTELTKSTLTKPQLTNTTLTGIKVTNTALTGIKFTKSTVRVCVIRFESYREEIELHIAVFLMKEQAEY